MNLGTKYDNIIIIGSSENNERFIFLYDNDIESVRELRKIIGRYASDPELNFGWEHAAGVSKILSENIPE